MRITEQRHLYVPAKRSEKISKRSEDIEKFSEDFARRSEEITRRSENFAALPHHVAENSRRPFWWIMQGGVLNKST